MITVKSKRERYTDESFKNAQSLQDFFRDGNTLTYDYVSVGNILYTMHEYDMGGTEITYANKKLNSVLHVDTSNRYDEQGFTDATVWIDNDPYYLRNDINYAE